MPPEMIWSLVSLKVTLNTWYVFWNVWTDAFFLMSQSLGKEMDSLKMENVVVPRVITCNYNRNSNLFA